MKLKLSVFIGVVLCVVLVGVYGVLSRMFDSREGWRPNDVYSSLGGSSYSTVSYSSSHSGGLAVPAMSMRGGRSFSRRVVAPAFSYAPAYAPASSGRQWSSSSAQSPISYTASSATMKSFGGGGNVASSVSGGVAGNAASSVAAASVAAPAGLSVSMPSTSAYAYNTNRNTRSNTGDLSTLTSGEFATASSYAGIGQTTAGGPMGIRGRRNANGLDDNFIDWLDGLIGDGSPNEWYAYKIGDVFYFNYDNLYDLYIQAVENGQLPEGVSWEMFLQWFKGQSDTYAFPIPSGVWFMTVLALGYALMIYFKKRKLQKQL